MAHVSFTSNLRRHVPADALDAPGRNVRQVLEHVLAAHPSLRHFLLDDQGAVRNHVVIFIDGTPLCDRVRLTDPVQPGSDIHIMQALSGG